MPQQFLATNLARARNFAFYGANDPPLAFIDDAHRIVYIDNPKVASTSIKQALYGDIVDFKLGRDRFHKIIDDYAVPRLPSRAKSYTHIFVVRNPFSRLVSNFRDKVEGKAPRDWDVYNVRYFRLLFQHLGQMPVSDTPVSFEAFASAVARIPDWLADRHFASQTRWIGRVTDARHVRVLRFESLNEDWEAIRVEAGLPPLKTLNSTRLSDWTPYYTNQAVIDAVAKRYQRDLTQIAYAPPELV